MTRYAIYYAPTPDSPWFDAGNCWLGRDAVSGETFSQRSIAGIPDPMLENLTSNVRRYGLHATLKPPFRLQQGFSESHLIAMAEAFCAAQRPIAIDELEVRLLDDFLALRPTQINKEIDALAMRCVSHFDVLRAQPTAAELERRRRIGLSERQEMLLQQWGYPYTEEEFRFHLSLTDSLGGVDDEGILALRSAAQERFESARNSGPLMLDGLTIFREEEAGAPFLVWKRFSFGAQQRVPMPATGRLFFCVGPSGVGKDTLLQWVRERLPSDRDIVFARRTITRPAHASESHEEIDTAGFWELAANDQFMMLWQANELCYGIRCSIEAELKAGRDVIVNGSREYVPKLLKRFPSAQVIWIEAEDALIRERIAARDRESGSALRARLERSAAFTPPDDPKVIRIDNSKSVEIAGERLLTVLASKRQA